MNWWYEDGVQSAPSVSRVVRVMPIFGGALSEGAGPGYGYDPARGRVHVLNMYSLSAFHPLNDERTFDVLWRKEMGDLDKTRSRIDLFLDKHVKSVYVINCPAVPAVDPEKHEVVVMSSFGGVVKNDVGLVVLRRYLNERGEMSRKRLSFNEFIDAASRGDLSGA